MVVVDVLGDEVALSRVDVVQPVLWAVMVSLAELWRSFGVVPSAVVGHSQGEIAAACVAGALSLEDGARVVALRSRALLALSGRGGMVSVPVSADRLRGRPGLSVAAVNGPVSTVVSGSVEVLDAVLAEFPEAKRIPVDYASHSVQVEEIQRELADALVSVRPRTGEVPFYSTVTGRLTDTVELDGEYWYRNLRETVEFRSAVEGLLELGHTVFVEASPHPVLTIGIQDTADATDTDILVTGSLRRDDGGLASFLTALARLHVRGVAVEWRAAFTGLDAHAVDLPTYAFQRRRFWAASLQRTPGAGELDHPLLGALVPLPESGGGLLTGVLTLAGQPWLAEHSVSGVVLFPGAGFVELVLQAGLWLGCGVVEELTLEGPLVFSERGGVEVQVVVGGVGGGGCRSVSVFSCRGGEWVRHAVGVLGVGLVWCRVWRWCGRRWVRCGLGWRGFMRGWRSGGMCMGRCFGGCGMRGVGGRGLRRGGATGGGGGRCGALCDPSRSARRRAARYRPGGPDHRRRSGVPAVLVEWGQAARGRCVRCPDGADARWAGHGIAEGDR
ncbi:hypothetical protein BV401_06385 [Streptomyces malaysiensis subsp. malaysiensis]|uniref:PKS/mFAS DH domain-containing protein n=1 Tax=Streptomyces autolyticus TaxID=75293 RepID=A0ABM6H8C0_9ACTN|nr:hypothetical protein BV401_06385 [Streptomyces autolyticus]